MKKFTALLVNLICAILISYLCLKGSGFFNPPNFFDIIGFTSLILLLSSSSLLFYILLVPIIILHAFYTPVGLSFGEPTYAYIASLLATDLTESKEFLTQISVNNYLIASSIILLLIIFRASLLWQKIQWHKYIHLLAIAIFFTLLTTSPLKLFTESYTATLKVYNEIQTLEKLQLNNGWGKSELVNSKYDDYILVIGESARRDYMNAYGYPVANTPFMSSAKGTLVKGLSSGGTNTIASLRLMLTKPTAAKWEPNYQYTLVDLVKSADIKTYWLSMQGQLGTYDTPISSIGHKSDEKVFLRAGDSFSQNLSDDNILPELEKVLAQNSKQKRFIVLHLYGSHPNACERVENYPLIYSKQQIEQKYQDINCYISSIKQTDELLANIHQRLEKNYQKTNRSFSMIYFADHGLVHQEIDGKIRLNNSHASRFHYDIPLFRISSDDNKRLEYTSFKSALNFTDGIAQWIGIQNPKLNTKIDLFNGIDDIDDYGLIHKLKKIPYPEDPAIVIPLIKN